MKQQARLILATLLALILLSSCLPGDGKASADKPAGFWTGIWHGAVAPVSLVVQIFNPAIRVYETHNKGFWYDLGFWLALASGGGGAGAGAAARRRRGERS